MITDKDLEYLNDVKDEPGLIVDNGQETEIKNNMKIIQIIYDPKEKDIVGLAGDNKLYVWNEYHSRWDIKKRDTPTHSLTHYFGDVEEQLDDLKIK